MKKNEKMNEIVIFFKLNNFMLWKIGNENEQRPSTRSEIMMIKKKLILL